MTLYIYAKAQSITKAAKKLKISQSALSIMMNKLESSIGYPLLNRQGRTIRITRYGEVVLYYSYILLNEMKDIQHAFFKNWGNMPAENLKRRGHCDSLDIGSSSHE